ncbi:Na+/melibiose symporter-like transporter [Actinoplanes campanulatus]|uniref:Na+/melibiose symporter-like transporter n=1 Tax=Actinoplanes campanulatus TaxID=113559 RepID=A0A7W5AH66_9ACTN|nr:MFS transporter [Actinoplanes campanulatus]MBB3096005.1 Na+/melibiose symporter-like transporter [Actinoplanes campanulatus]GGN13046.1 MFS transporter [Actinoplanes campanulatus]GID36901.1 MFS transporter [Actinoplanes campanulatus]
MTTQQTETRTRTGDLIAYATGSIGMGVWVTVPGLLLLYFLTHTLGVTPFLAGLTLLLPKIIDVVVHPYLGSRSDAAARRSGHRLGLLRVGLLLAVAMAGMFTVPAGLSGAGAALWVGGWFIAGNLLFACFQVPYLTTPSDLRIGYHDRTRVFMFRMLFLTLGLLGAGVAAPALVAAGERGDYARMAVLLSGIMVVSGLVAVTGVRRLTAHAGFRTPAADAHSTLGDIAVAWRDRDFRALVLSYLFTGATTHLFLAALPFYTEHVFGDSELTAVFMGAFLGPAVVAGPVWARVSRRIGKQRGLVICQVVFVAGSLAPLLGYGVAPAVAVVVVLGVAFAGLQLFAFSMVPDAVAAAEARGAARAGAYTGVWTATEATGTAVGPYVYSAALALGGFIATTEGRTVVQPESAHTALLVGFTVVPAVLMAAACFFQLRWTLDRSRDPSTPILDV